MRNGLILSFLCLVLGCADDRIVEQDETRTSQLQQEKIELNETKIVVSEFQAILDSANVAGAILIYDPQTDEYFSNDFEWANEGKLPASTYKIPNSIIALETGVVESDSTIFKWNGEERRLDVWEQDLIFKDAFQFSCVPCYQEVARNIGVHQMNSSLQQLDYGRMEVDSTNIDTFWLTGTSRISQMEQINFLQRLYESKLPISKRTESLVKDMMIIEASEEVVIRGKTGWSISNGENNGWFVGILTSENRTYYFATNIEPKPEFDMSYFPNVRKSISYDALQHMKIITEN